MSIENSNKQNGRIRHYMMAVVSVCILVFLDQFTKQIVVQQLKGQSAYVLIRNVFQLEYLENRGAAFGLFQNQRIFFYISVLVISLVVIWFYGKVPMEKKYLPLQYLCSIDPVWSILVIVLTASD